MQAVVDPAQPRFKAEEPFIERIYAAVVLIEPISYLTSERYQAGFERILPGRERILFFRERILFFRERILFFRERIKLGRELVLLLAYRGQCGDQLGHLLGKVSLSFQQSFEHRLCCIIISHSTIIFSTGGQAVQLKKSLSRT